MVIKICLVLMFLFMKVEADIYEDNCIKCHKKLPVSIDKYFYRYLLRYSSEQDTKKAMINYLLNPTKQTTIMSNSFISRFGIKKKTPLDKKTLKKVINIYWDKYDVSKRLK